MGRNRSSAHTKAQRAGRERDRNRCQVCGSKDHVEGHHIVDHQFGGAASVDNIIALYFRLLCLSKSLEWLPKRTRRIIFCSGSFQMRRKSSSI